MTYIFPSSLQRFLKWRCRRQTAEGGWPEGEGRKKGRKRRSNKESSLWLGGSDTRGPPVSAGPQPPSSHAKVSGVLHMLAGHSHCYRYNRDVKSMSRPLVNANLDTRLKAVFSIQTLEPKNIQVSDHHYYWKVH